MGDFIKNVIVPGITIVTALLAGYVNYSVSNVKSALDLQKGELEQQQASLKSALDVQQASLNKLTTERSLKKFDEDLTFRVYTAVTDALKTGDARQQQATSALVIVMAPEPLRTQLLQVFDKSQTTSPEVRNEVAKVLKTEQSFHQEESLIKPAAAASRPSPAPGGGWEDWDVDVFWCEGSGEDAREQADKVVAALKQAGARGRLRSRVLPDSINARSGYRISGFVIRRDLGEEERAAALQALAQKTLPATTFEISVSASATRWYLSAFVCP